MSWLAGRVGKQEPRFQNQTGLGWKSDSSHSGLHFLSEPQFPHLSNTGGTSYSQWSTAQRQQPRSHSGQHYSIF